MPLQNIYSLCFHRTPCKPHWTEWRLHYSSLWWTVPGESMPNIKIPGNGTEAAWFNLPFTEIPPKWTTEFKICTLCFWNKGFFVKTLWNYSGRDIHYLNISIWIKHVIELQKNEVQKSMCYFKRCVYVLRISGTQICTKPIS